MKRFTLPLLAFSAALLGAGYALGQNKAKSAPAPAAPAAAPAPKQQKLVRVATLNSVEANREFQANVQLVQTQRQAAVQLNDAMEKEKDSAKKQDLKKQFDTVMAKLNENNQGMVKAYGFSLDRNYTIEIEKAHIYMLVSDEEAAKLEKAAQEAEKAEKAKAAKKK